jgi:hypothetical protein
MKEARIAENTASPLKNRRMKGKGNVKSILTPGMKEKLEKFKKKMKYYEGAKIVMNPKINKNIEIMPNDVVTVGKPLGIVDRNTS